MTNFTENPETTLGTDMSGRLNGIKEALADGTPASALIPPTEEVIMRLQALMEKASLTLNQLEAMVSQVVRIQGVRCTLFGNLPSSDTLARAAQQAAKAGNKSAALGLAGEAMLAEHSPLLLPASSKKAEY